ncbi:MAG: tripartite tricarboxylate transporter substrate binding protein [Burkholderiales bacterium]|nr:tripartite tricarboxylate transporter substrate binding protein [Burkholderiales bacterium]
MHRRDFMLLALAAAAGSAHADSYPTRPIRIIIPASAGGGTDIVARLVGSKLAEMNGWQVVPENKPGAGTALGLAETARSSNAGYVLGMGLTDNVTVAPLLTTTGYDPIKDLVPVAQLATTSLALLVPANSPYKTLGDMIRAAKVEPDKLTYGTSGTGGSVHLSMEMLQASADFKMRHVPYKGSSQAIADLIGGHVHVAGSSVTSAAALLAAGNVRALAVTSAKRSNMLPNVPTVAELGYQDFSFDIYYGVMAPVGLPQPVLTRLNSDINKILQRSDVRATLLAQGLEPSPATPEQFAELIKTDIQKARDVIKRANIRVGS